MKRGLPAGNSTVRHRRLAGATIALLLVAVVIAMVSRTARQGPRAQPLTTNAASSPEARTTPSSVPSAVGSSGDGAALSTLPAAAAAAGNAVTQDGQKRWDELQACMDPQRDGWTSEAIAERIASRLKALGERLGQPAPLNVDDVAAWFPAETQCTPLVPAAVAEVLRDQSMRVERAAAVQDDAPPGPLSREAMRDELNRLRDEFVGMTDVRYNFKVYRIDANEPAAQAAVIFYARGSRSQGAQQISSIWHTTWRIPESPTTDGEAGLELAVLRTDEFERVTTFLGQPTLFSDQTETVLGGDESFRRQLRHGAGYWMQRLPAYLSPRLLEGHIGLAIGDVNNDGRDDIYVCQPGGLPNRLYVHNSDGTVTDIARTAGVDILDWSYSALIVDLNNDDRQDLIVMADGNVLIYEGLGDGRFALRNKLEGSFEYALSAADYDLDGDLDLYVCNYFAESSDGLAQLERTDPLHDSNTGGPNALFQNQGNWQFVDVTEATGLDVSNRRWTLACGWEDFDNDGDVDLYVVNDFGHNNLYRNDGGRFVEIAAEAGAVDANQGMSVTWGDYDHDGQMDIYISNMFSSAGNRVTTQPNFMPGAGPEIKSLYLRLARGNTLLRNQGDGTFGDVSEALNVTMGRWAWASLFTDINNDGWEDLVVANGYLTQDLTDDL